MDPAFVSDWLVSSRPVFPVLAEVWLPELLDREERPEPRPPPLALVVLLPPEPLGVPPVEAELVPLAGWVDPLLVAAALPPPAPGEMALLPVAPVPAAALGVEPTVSSSESWLVEPVPVAPWLSLSPSACWPHFISGPEPLPLRRDRKYAPAAAAAVATAAAAIGRERALSRRLSPL